MSLRTLSAAALLFATTQAVVEDSPGEIESPEDLTPGDLTPGDYSPGEDSPLDNTPKDSGEVFEDWCNVATDCWLPNQPNIPSANDVACKKGICECSGEWEDPVAKGGESGGWVCVRIGDPIPEIEMEYRIVFDDPAVVCPPPTEFSQALKDNMMTYYEMSSLDLSEPFCGSIHYSGRGSSKSAGKTGFGNAFANNPANPYGAPTVTGQKAGLAAASCNPVSPVLTMALIGSLCQPLSCIEGYTWVNSGNINVLSACVVNPPPGVIATLPPSPPGTPFIRIEDSDDSMHYGGLLGIAFGCAILIGAVVAAIVYMKTKNAHTELDEEEQQELEQENNGPDKEA